MNALSLENNYRSLLIVQGRIDEFFKKMEHARGIEYTYQQNNRLKLIWTMAELEKEGIDITAKEIATALDVSLQISRNLIKSCRDDRIIERLENTGRKVIYKFNGDYLEFMDKGFM